MMRVTVDADVCTGHGRCYALAPDVFAPDDFGHCEIVVADGEVPDGAGGAGAHRRRQLPRARDRALGVATVVSVRSGEETFTVEDLQTLTDVVAATWIAASERDWSVPAGTVSWSCLATADHAVDCVYAPAFFLASRRTDDYPAAGEDLRLGEAATPAELAGSLQLATRLLAAVVHDAPAHVRAILFRAPEPLVGLPRDFAPRAAVELALHAHDVALGLDIGFEPADELCGRLREHTRPWPMWARMGPGLDATGDPWADLLRASGRSRP